ncbi:hypothetical protein Tco_0755800, partial [Tanacetum coccineum]
ILQVHEPSSHDMGKVHGKGDPWNPLNCLVEVANRSKSSNVKSEPQHDNGRSDVDATESPKPRKKRKYRKKKAASTKEQEGEPLGQIQGSFVRLKWCSDNVEL